MVSKGKSTIHVARLRSMHESQLASSQSANSPHASKLHVNKLHSDSIRRVEAVFGVKFPHLDSRKVRRTSMPNKRKSTAEPRQGRRVAKSHS